MTLIHGDCMDHLDKIGHVDIILTDPPTYHFEYAAFLNKAEIVSILTGQPFLTRRSPHSAAKQTDIYKSMLEAIMKHSDIKIVLDPYMGTGSIGIAAIDLGLDFIGIEKNKDWFDLASERLCGKR